MAFWGYLIYFCVFVGTFVHIGCRFVPSMKEVRFEVVEESEPNVVGTLFDVNGLSSKVSEAQRESVRFYMTSDSDMGQKYFRVEPETGSVKAFRIDREDICAYEHYCFVNFSVRLEPPTEFDLKLIKVSVEIIDINDHAPAFSNPVLNLNFMEEIPSVKPVSLPCAIDIDSPRFANPSYRLASSHELFELKVSQPRDGDPQILLIMKGVLDREVQSKYQLKIIAEDKGRPPRRGELIVNITVLDLNDNAPKFNQSKYHAKIAENWSLYKPILRVSAADRDISDNGKVTYEFSLRTRKRLGLQFRIDSRTGDLYLKKTLDYETTKSYQITVVAKDGGMNQLHDTTTILLTITDVNDQRPKITFQYPKGYNMPKVSENSPKGTYVLNVRVEDMDSGQSGQFHCTLNSRVFKLKKVHEGYYDVVTEIEFDREVKEQHNVTVDCADRGTPKLMSRKTFSVQILDKNDNKPRFYNLPYKCNISENNYIDQKIDCRVNTRDPDLGDNGRVKYALEGPGADQLRIHPDYGTIRAKKVFDFEASIETRFAIVATDQGQPSHSSTAQVVLHIIDVNDEPPKFKKMRYRFSLGEGEPPGATVGTVIATDGDAAPYNQISFSLRGHTDTFAIDPRSGKIKTKKQLDREAFPKYDISVVAMDTGSSPLSSTVSVLVVVTDKNDNQPIIDFPNPFNDTVYVPSNIPVGHKITNIKAHDDDTGHNAQLKYGLSSELEDSYFGVDQSTGVVFLQSAIDADELEQRSTIVGKVTVEDHGIEPKRANAVLRIVFDKSILFVPEKQPRRTNHQILLSSQNMIILICVAGGAGFVIFILIVILVCSRKRPEERIKYQAPPGVIQAYPPYLIPGTTRNKHMCTNDYDEEDLEQDRSAPSSRNSTLNRNRDNFGVVHHQSMVKTMPVDNSNEPMMPPCQA